MRNAHALGGLLGLSALAAALFANATVLPKGEAETEAAGRCGVRGLCGDYEGTVKQGALASTQRVILPCEGTTLRVD